MPIASRLVRRGVGTAIFDTANFLTATRPLWFLLLGSLVVSVAYTLWLFDLRFIDGTSATWNNARGVIDGSWADISTALSGYYVFMKEGWHLPLFSVAKLGAPAGINVIYTDSIPIVCMLGRLLYQGIGIDANLYGIWLCFCIVATAVCHTWLVNCLGARGVAAAVMATVSGLCMPALLFRWGHMALMAQFEILLALVFCVRQGRRDRAAFFLVWPALLLVLALWTHVYLFPMVFAIVAAGLAQAVAERRLPLAHGTIVLLVWIIVAIGTVKLSGHLVHTAPLGGGSFGVFSMNALAPIIPQRGGLTLAKAFPMPDATDGQYEGFNYLGAGTILLLPFALYWQRQELCAALRRRACLLAALILLTGLALSNKVFVGSWEAAIIPVPPLIMVLCSLFRSSGRFFWPAGYWLTASSIAAAGRRGGKGAFVLLLAAGLQWIDTAPLRVALAESTRHAAPLPLDAARWRRAIARHEFVRLFPPFACLPPASNWDKAFALQIQLLAARANVATNTVYAARYNPDCAHDTVPAALNPTELRIYFNQFENAEQEQSSAKRSRQFCRAGQNITVCSKVLRAAEINDLLAKQ